MYECLFISYSKRFIYDLSKQKKKKKKQKVQYLRKSFDNDSSKNTA